MMPRTKTNLAKKNLPTVLSEVLVPQTIPRRFLGFFLVAIVAMTGKVVNSEEYSYSTLDNLTPAERVQNLPYVECPDLYSDEWDSEQCQDNLYFISKGPDEDYFELEDVSADPKFAEIIDNIEYPLYPWGFPLEPTANPDDIAYENITYATIGEQMERFSADAFLIYQNGQLIYEKYVKAGDIAYPDVLTGGENKIRANDFTQNDRHALYSATKPFMGMVFAKLLAEVDNFNEDDMVTQWIPELVNTSAFNTATVRMIADMSVDFQYDEQGILFCDFDEWIPQTIEYILNGKEGEYPLPIDCEHYTWRQISEIEVPKYPDELIPGSNYTEQDFRDALPSKFEFIKQMKRGNATGLNRQGLPRENGAKFQYRSMLTDVLALVCSSVIEEAYPDEYESVEDYFEKKIWAKLGTDQDMSLSVNADGVPVWWSRASATARDLLRSGIMLLNGGKNHKGEQVLPKDAIDDIFDGSDLSRSQFAVSYANPDLKSTGIIYNPAFFPDVEECEQMTSDWSYRDQFRSYNPGKGKGTGEIALYEGYNGQSVYVDRKANLVIVQLSVDQNYEFPHLGVNNQPAFHALSSYFRCNLPIGTMDAAEDLIQEEIAQDTEDNGEGDVEDDGEENVEDDVNYDGELPWEDSIEDSITVSSAKGGCVSIRKYSVVFLFFIGFFF